MERTRKNHKRRRPWLFQGQAAPVNSMTEKERTVEHLFIDAWDRYPVSMTSVIDGNFQLKVGGEEKGLSSTLTDSAHTVSTRLSLIDKKSP